MSLRVFPDAHSDHPLAAESTVVVAVLLGVSLWQFVVRTSFAALTVSIHGPGGFVVGGLVTGGVLLGGLAVCAIAYTNARDIDIDIRRPPRSAPHAVLLALGGPVALTVATKLVGLLSGVSYSSLTETSFGPDATMSAVLPLVGLDLLVGVPLLLLVSQVFVQGSFRRVAGGRRTVVLTTITTSFLFVNVNRGFVLFPDRGRLVGLVVFLALLGVGLAVSARTHRRWVRYLGFAPLFGLALLVVGAELLALSSLATAVSALTHVLVLGIAGDVFERTGSLTSSALAYLSLFASNAVIVLYEAGVTSW